MKKSTIIEILRTLLSVLLALGFSFIIIALISKEPVLAISKMIFGPLSSKRLLANVIELAIPLTFTGIAVSIMFTANQINLGTEGAFHLGGLSATLVGLLLPLSAGIHPIVSILVGGLSGAIFTALPALLKIITGSSELVSSLMLNYIALFFANYVLSYKIRDTSAGAMASHALPESVRLPAILSGTNIHVGIFLAILTAILVHLFIYRTSWGYQLRVAGENQEFAKYSGMKIVGIILISQLLGGFVAGIGGSIQLLGMYRRFTWTALLGYGWDAIIVMTLAKKKPLLIPFSALFLAYIRIGADIMSRASDVSPEIIAITQGIIIVLIASNRFLAKAKDNIIKKEARANLEEVQS